jgi:hypothetical protein
MFQVLTNIVDNVYENESDEKINSKKIELENKTESKDIEMKISSSFNIELKVANDPNFRPKIPISFSEDKHFSEFIELMKRSWSHSPKDRPSFNEITMILQEKYENIKI